MWVFPCHVCSVLNVQLCRVDPVAPVVSTSTTVYVSVVLKTAESKNRHTNVIRWWWYQLNDFRVRCFILKLFRDWCFCFQNVRESFLIQKRSSSLHIANFLKGCSPYTLTSGSFFGTINKSQQSFGLIYYFSQLNLTFY